MTRTWDEMKPRERDALVAAKIMEWSESALRYVRTEDGDYFSGEDGLPDYTTDYNACREVEDRIERQGLQESYLNALVHICDPDAHPQDDLDMWRVTSVRTDNLWSLVHGAPEQRCRAALRAMGVAV